MLTNPVIQTLLNRKSIRQYRDEVPSEEMIQTIVRAGQQAPFALQLCSLLLSRETEQHAYHAPLMFTVCVDVHRLELVMAQRNWQIVSNDLFLLILGIQDAALMAENMVIAAESLGLGSCFLGNTPNHAGEIIEQYKLPKRVFPLVQLVMGYPAENPPTRPRYPLAFTLFEGEYPHLDEPLIREAMQTMDEGYLRQEYYRKLDAMIPLEGNRSETFTFETYSWTEHISRKAGQWWGSLKKLYKQMDQCGFRIGLNQPNSAEEP